MLATGQDADGDPGGNMGCWFHDAWLRAWADSRRGRAEPDGGDEGRAGAPGIKAHRLSSRW
jgi:hypothetical protein